MDESQITLALSCVVLTTRIRAKELKTLEFALSQVSSGQDEIKGSQKSTLILYRVAILA
jgi:hypothetical protein